MHRTCGKKKNDFANHPYCHQFYKQLQRLHTQLNLDKSYKTQQQKRISEEGRKKKGRCEEDRRQTLVPWVRVTRVLPTFRTVKTDGALMSYQSFLANGSTLWQQNNEMKSDLITKPQGKITILGFYTHAFFFPPFFPLEILLFFLKCKRNTRSK